MNYLNKNNMKKIDFSKLKVEVRIEEYSNIDVRKDLGNMLFNMANTLELDHLSRKVFNAPNKPVNLDGEEYRLLMQALQNGAAKYSIIKAIESNAKDVSLD